MSVPTCRLSDCHTTATGKSNAVIPVMREKATRRVKHFATKKMETRITMAVTFSTPKATSSTIGAQQQLKR